MPQITYIAQNGSTITVEVSAGTSVMEGAVRNGISGIDADCGGACACATCHVYIDPLFNGLTGSPSAMETSMLDFASEADERSRLSCQIKVTEAMHGMTVYLPASQG